MSNENGRALTNKTYFINLVIAKCKGLAKKRHMRSVKQHRVKH
jgi:hypothetical protein